jgi:cytochrome c5
MVIMKKAILPILGLVVMVGLTWFTLTDKETPPTPEELKRMNAPINPDDPLAKMAESMRRAYPPPIKPASLPEANSQGAQLYQKFCTRCHGLFSAKMHTAKEWPIVTADMYKRTDRLYNMMGMLIFMKIPKPTEREIITNYLAANGLKPLEAANIPEPSSTGAVFFTNACDKCHGLPDLSLHKAGEWRPIIERMRKNMRSMQKRVIVEEEASRIAEYLDNHSAK